MTTQPMTGIEVRARFFPLAFLLFLCKPMIEIDGVANRRSWGTSFFELPPGRHKVTVYFWYIGKPRCGENSIDVDLQPGSISRVSFYMPPWMLSRGSIKITP